MDIKQGDLVIDTFYYDDNRLMEPLYIYLYVLSVVSGGDGRETVTLAPAIYKNLKSPPPYDFTLDDVRAQCNVRRCEPYEYYQMDLHDANKMKTKL